jgi:hypothetical protein
MLIPISNQHYHLFFMPVIIVFYTISITIMCLYFHIARPCTRFLFLKMILILIILIDFLIFYTHL